jgi:hypothetical protein
MKIFILRWNPAISSWTDEKFREALVECREGPFAMDWSIRDWESVEYGDIAVLCRVGTDADGIVAVGWFDGRVEESDSWRRAGSKCHYAFFWMRLAQDPVATGLLMAAVLEKKVPGIGWHGGHSGVVVPPESAPALARVIADALESGPILPGAAPFECLPDGPKTLARNLRLSFCPESIIDEFRRAFPGHKITFHREDDPDGESPDCGECRILVSNPNGGCPLRIDLGEDPTLFFGGSHIHFFDNDDDWSVLIDYAKRIVAGSMRALIVSSAGEWRWTSFDGHAIRTDTDAFRVIANDCSSRSGHNLPIFARKGATLEWTAWDPADNQKVELSADWFKTIARPTGLDAVRASREAENQGENGAFASFEFDFHGDQIECRKRGRRWTVERDELLSRNERPAMASASSFKALLETVIPNCRKTTVRDALAGVHAFDVEGCWTSQDNLETVGGKAKRCCGGTDNASAECDRFVVEVPLDCVGLYGVAFYSANVPSHFLSVSLDKEEIEAVFPVFEEMNAKFGVGIDRCEEAIIPSRFAATAWKTLRVFRKRAADTAVRNAVDKLLPVFKKAAELHMPIALWL